MSPSDHEGLVRPFLLDKMRSETEPAPPPSSVPVVRAYMMTGGRTTSDSVKLEFEAMLSLTSFGVRRTPSLLFEQAKIAECVSHEPKSVAEVSVALNIAIGVAQVLCGDMVGDGLLEVHMASSTVSEDVSLITRLIQGVRAL
jgi:Protein of unknown function (DUF742)